GGEARRVEGRNDARTLVQQVLVWVGAALEGVRIAGPDRAVVRGRWIHERRPLLRIILREQALDRLLGREGGIAVIEVAVGEGKAECLVDRVDVARAVVAHRLEVE